MKKLKGACGWIRPHDQNHVKKYPYSAVAPRTASRVEKILTLPYKLDKYNQGSEGACVGYAATWMMSILNHRYYDANWLWNMAKKVDIWPDTNPGDNEGTTVRAAMDILRGLGHMRIVNKKQKGPSKADGILENRWAKNVDEVRTAIQKKNPVTIGVDWYTNFDAPVQKGKEWWIGEGSLGRIRAGHAVCVYGASDKRDAVKIVNNWGLTYPCVWLHYEILEKLLKDDGEVAIVTDRP